jgi:hypothetical protein
MLFYDRGVILMHVLREIEGGKTNKLWPAGECEPRATKISGIPRSPQQIQATNLCLETRQDSFIINYNLLPTWCEYGRGLRGRAF